MPHPHTAKSTTVGIPYLGMNHRDPYPSMAPEFCIDAVNMEPEGQYLRVRNGYIVVAGSATTDGATYGPTDILAIGAYSDQKIFAYCRDYYGNYSIFDLGAPTTWGSTTGTYVQSVGSTACSTVSVAYFGRRMAFVTEADFANTSRVYDGTSWSAWGFTNAGNPIGGSVVTSYKGRVYIFDTPNWANNTGAHYMYYSALDAVTGATTRVDITPLLKDSGVVRWAATLTSPSMRSDELFFAFGTHSGQIFVYSGDNPGAANWTLIGQFDTARPLYRNSIVKYGNDILIMTEAGIISLKALFLEGSEKGFDAITISSPINRYWQKIVGTYNLGNTDSGKGLAESRASGAYLAKEDKIYFMLHGYIDTYGNEAAEEDLFSGSNNYSGAMFVYNATSKAWTLHHLNNLMSQESVSGSAAISGGVTSFRGSIYYFSQGSVYMLSHNLYFDSFNLTTQSGGGGVSESGDSNNYQYFLNTNYYQLSSVLDPIRLYGVVAVLKSGGAIADAGITMIVDSDFGVRESARTGKPIVEGYQSIFLSAGESGSNFRLRLNGAIDFGVDPNTPFSVGLEIYNIGLVSS
jgi:hypothetical protein